MSNKKLKELHAVLAEKLLEKVKDPECKASFLNVARQFLKDNGIDAIPTEGSTLQRLLKNYLLKYLQNLKLLINGR